MEHPSARWLRRIATVWGVVAASLVMWPAAGESLVLGTLPGDPRITGFVVSLDMEGAGGNGYQPMSMDFISTGTGFQRDRHLEIILTPNGPGKTALDFRFRRAITLPEGAARFQLPVYMPRYVPWESIRVELREDGNEIQTGTRTLTLPSGVRSRDADQITLVGILSGDDSAAKGEAWETFPDVRTLVTVLGNGPLPEDAKVHRLAHLAAQELAERVQPASVQFRPFDESHLHDQWLGYSQLDVILVPAPVLERIERSQPARFQQLLSWVAAGGSLWVHASGLAAEDSFLATLSQQDLGTSRGPFIKGIQPVPDLQADNDTSEWIYNWGGVTRGSASYSLRGSLSLKPRRLVYEELKKEDHPFARRGDPLQVMAGVRTSVFGLGRIVAIDSADPFPGTFQFWNTIAQCHLDGQIIWRDRIGVDVSKGNANYWMWLIPSVGQPPVKSFVFLNTLFVILIGPVCYWILRKRQRLYFLYFVAPTLALLVTASLFAYALGSDGISTKVRARQLTWVDSANGYLVEQSRQTYYDVLGRSQGIELSSDTAVFPVRHTPALNRYSVRGEPSGRVGELWIQGDQQSLRGAFLPSRDQVQYLTMRPIRSQSGLRFQFESGGGSVTNGLSLAIRQLLVCDVNGVTWEASEVASGATAALTQAASGRLGAILGPDALPPLGEVPMLRNNVVRLGGGAAGLQVSYLERRLDRWSQRLPQGAFVAVADVIEDRIGIEGAKVRDSVHVLMGEIE